MNALELHELAIVDARHARRLGRVQVQERAQAVLLRAQADVRGRKHLRQRLLLVLDLNSAKHTSVNATSTNATKASHQTQRVRKTEEARTTRSRYSSGLAPYVRT